MDRGSTRKQLPLTPDTSEWFIDCTTDQLAAELLRRHDTAVITVVSPSETTIYITNTLQPAVEAACDTAKKLLACSSL